MIDTRCEEMEGGREGEEEGTEGGRERERGRESERERGGERERMGEREDERGSARGRERGEKGAHAGHRSLAFLYRPFCIGRRRQECMPSSRLFGLFTRFKVGQGTEIKCLFICLLHTIAVDDMIIVVEFISVVIRFMLTKFPDGFQAAALMSDSLQG